MLKKENNFAFIDGQNLNLGIKGSGWLLDLKKFRVYLREKYSVQKAYYFIGYVPGNSDLYSSLQQYGYILIFKPTFKNSAGIIKGNCDAELVLQTMIDFNHYERAVIVSGDGDFSCLIKYLKEKDKLKTVLVPDKNKYSSLLIKASNNIAFMNDLRNKLEFNAEK
ncbi:MAG: hypothetical protein FD143_1308 [Ignavibacteria bacterium]|nr:MAG: hypothetical protein FD143_1308 [Ignavibacteria bacterium]KAF0160827.1 MAG: hypothetical protein FD188_1432 [Ignavibacteria bacterium]